MAAKRPQARLDADALYEKAVRALARHGRTAFELRRLLGPKAISPAALADAFERLRDHGYLNDEHLASTAASYQKEVLRHGRSRALRDLRARGVAADTAAAAVASSYGADSARDEDALLRAFVAKKRIRRPADQRQAAALFRKWMVAGFSIAACQRALRAWRLDAEWLDAVEVAPEEEE